MPQEIGEILSEAFDLSRAGGIYFEGGRCQSNNRTLLLFVGLGGTGTDELIRVKNQVLNRMKPRTPDAPIGTIPENMAFLAIDTAAGEVQDKHYSNTKFAQDGSEILPIGAQGAYQTIINELLAAKKHKQPHALWLPDGTKAIGSAAGAGGRRTVGRVGFFKNYGKIVSKVKDTLTLLGQKNPGVHDYKILLFAGIGGGTGSGTFIDMAYLLRHEGRLMDQSCQLLGYLFMPDLNAHDGGNPDAMNSNAFAALKELDYLMESGRKGVPFIQAYTPNPDTRTHGEIPFDFCHIINTRDNQGNVYSKSQVMNAVAETIFTYIADEPSLGAEAKSGLQSIYDNVDYYLTLKPANSHLPANHQYLAVGSTCLRMPYLEINTLLGCRMFEYFSQNVFNNQVTDTKFDEDLDMLGLGRRSGDQTFQDRLASILEARASQLSKLSTFGYDDIWGESNTAYDTAYHDCQNYQTKMNECFGTAPSELEGKFREYLKTIFVAHDRGPFYAASMVKGLQAQNLCGLLRTQAKYFKAISVQEQGNLDKIEKELKEIYADGSGKWGVDLVQRTYYKKKYLKTLGDWRRESLLVDKYDYLSQLANKLAEIFEKYYTKILQPITDILTHMVVIFDNNLTKLNNDEQNYAKKPDPTLLTTPLKFEKDMHMDFDLCIQTAKQNFLPTLLEEMEYWIRCDFDHVSGTNTNANMPVYLSRFISKCFKVLYDKITLETVFKADLPPGGDLKAHIQSKITSMYHTSYPLFTEIANAAEPDSVILLAIPAGLAEIDAAADKFIAATQTDTTKITKKLSGEVDRISIVKVDAGYALYMMQDLSRWEDCYENIAKQCNTGMYLHLREEWLDNLPSPNIELAWQGAHSCDRTKQANAKYRKYFDRCRAEGLISQYKQEARMATVDGETENGQPFNSYVAYLKDAAEIPMDQLQLYGDLRQKISQLDVLKRRIYPDSCGKLPLEGQGTYAINPEDPTSVYTNICENVIRDPAIWVVLEKQCRILDRLAELRYELDDPGFFVRALICNMIQRDNNTKHVLLQHEQNDPLPQMLIDGTQTGIATNNPEYYYRVYIAFRSFIRRPNAAGQNKLWGDVIKENWTSEMQQNVDPTHKAAFLKALEEYGSIFTQLGDYYQKEADKTPAAQMETKQHLQSLADFYNTAFQCAGQYYNVVIN